MPDRGVERALLCDHVDQSPGERGGRVDILRGHHQPARSAPADQPWQQCGVDHRGDADTHLRHAEFGVMGGDPEIAGGRNLQSAAEAPPGKPGDHGRGKVAHGLAQVAQPRDEGFRGFLVEPRHLLDIGAADHALLALAGQDHGANVLVAGKLFEPLAHPVGDGGGEDVEGARIADREANDASIVAVDAAVGIEHFHFVFPGFPGGWHHFQGHCTGLSRAGGRGALRGGTRRDKMMGII